MLRNPDTISKMQQIVFDLIKREYSTEELQELNLLMIAEPKEYEFLVFRGPVLRLWIIIEKQNDPDNHVIVFDPERRIFGIATSRITTIPGKGFFLRYCDSFRHALEKSGIVLQ